ncbi:elongation factor G [Virgisporangium ochraceum]|uniref:Tetracycline resistance protein, tetM/tetO subfamily n=1 Tax=Virgisporangium ochraceum TaxID=65505 RepID=A0A8J3ZVA5_9ACTN|nr:TetM/TetW/TetO/TetS family tetracycline resistance ribosomal protection protein [Virgisporangium ochraceum]GIJ68076.1 tetracycline resistance protein, tetM/tetO subfamily [Virgisporangium ochraceum]
MPRRTLNLGVLAHVDAGKTSLTERLLYEAGVVDRIGSVDAGTTSTDSLELERQRGITIRSAVASFAAHGTLVNLIDTPGHPDFIAEVDRVLEVLDGAVLVVSAVEGVQPQTRVLMRALRRLRVPTLVFVNKIDRPGASDARTLDAITRRLTPAAVAMGRATGLGRPDARFLPWRPAEARRRLVDTLSARDDALLAEFLAGEPTVERLHAALAGQVEAMIAHPVFFGSAITGAGIEPLVRALVTLLPAATSDAGAPFVGRVFKIEKGPVAYVRVDTGTLRVRDRVSARGGRVGRVTALGVFTDRGEVAGGEVGPGGIAAVRGLASVQVGDVVTVGAVSTIRGDARTARHFAPPTLSTVVVPDHPEQRAGLRQALAFLAAQDPLIDVRQDDVRHEISLSLYGEVQKEVVAATLAAEYGVAVTFRDTTPICVERPAGTGSSAEVLFAPGNPFTATLGLRVEPAPPGSGVTVRTEVDLASIPMYVYKRQDAFAAMMAGYIRAALAEGLCGWEVTDCVVTVVRSGYQAPSTTAADFRRLTPVVLMRALAEAGTRVCEPLARARVEVPAETVGPLLAVLGRASAVVTAQTRDGDLVTVEALLPATAVPAVQRQLPGTTGGEGSIETDFGGYRPVTGSPPVRGRTTPDPRNLDEYLRVQR